MFPAGQELFDVKKLVQLIGERSCLWDNSVRTYQDKAVKQAAWEEVAEAMVPGWQHMSEEERVEAVAFVQKKWKSARDYYIREKKKSSDDGGYIISTKRNYYFSSLSFLDKCGAEETETPKSKRSRPIKEEVSMQQSDESNDFENRTTYDNPEHTLTIIANPANDEAVEQNRNFLMSFLPEMTKMTEKQNFRFRMEMMKALNKVRYQIPEYTDSKDPLD